VDPDAAFRQAEHRHPRAELESAFAGRHLGYPELIRRQFLKHCLLRPAPEQPGVAGR
jgi:hypothetical protein